jgi:zinc protease
LPDIPIERHRLDNGLRVLLSHDDSAPIVAVNLWYDVGSKHEKPGRTGFAHLFEHMMFQGSEHVAKGEHFAHIQQAGGTLNASTWLDRTNYFETLPSHELELGLWLESDRLASLLPAMTQEKLDNQREVVKNERRWSVDNQPYGTWDERIQAHLFPESHTYHHSTIGSMEDLNAASLEDVGEFFATYYAPNNAVLTVAGDFDREAALAMVEKHFGPIPANDSLPPPPDMAVPPLIGQGLRGEVADRVPLPRVYLAYRMPIFGSDAFDDLSVASDVLGVGRASRLYGRLVRERKLAQDVSVFPFPIIGGASMFTLWATAKPGVGADQLETALLDEIDLLAAEGPTAAELERVGNLHSAAVESSLERIAERADRLSMYTCLFDQPERINSEVGRYLAVDADRVRTAMTETLRPDNRLVLTYVPAEAPAEEAA